MDAVLAPLMAQAALACAGMLRHRSHHVHSVDEVFLGHQDGLRMDQDDHGSDHRTEHDRRSDCDNHSGLDYDIYAYFFYKANQRVRRSVLGTETSIKLYSLGVLKATEDKEDIAL